jgi:hypothetical protein
MRYLLSALYYALALPLVVKRFLIDPRRCGATQRA